ncbi:hypothetical protein U0070_013867 [Myodes glareolus]|uniref:Tribbles homolog 2 n=1 Tax=Myodes glareolus TaxID=447135 RepID=A0AAW0HN12_MYOGA
MRATNPAVQFGRTASEGKSGLQIFPRLKTRLCSGKGTPLVGRVRGASVASSRRTPGSSCQGHRDRWSLVCPGHRPHFLLPSEEDPGREQAATAGASADCARAQPWALSRASRRRALPEDCTNSTQGSSARSADPQLGIARDSGAAALQARGTLSRSDPRCEQRPTYSRARFCTAQAASGWWHRGACSRGSSISQRVFRFVCLFGRVRFPTLMNIHRSTPITIARYGRSRNKTQDFEELSSIRSAEPSQSFSPNLGSPSPPETPNLSHCVSCIGKYLLLEPLEGDHVFRAVHLHSGEELVCKVFEISCYQESLAPCFCLSAHSNINQITEILLGETKAYVFFERSYGDMHSFVRTCKKLREEEAARLFYQIASAVAHCHDGGLVLRDLKLRKFIFKDEESRTST